MWEEYKGNVNTPTSNLTVWFIHKDSPIKITHFDIAT
jgi:hypothetical protein